MKQNKSPLPRCLINNFGRKSTATFSRPQPRADARRANPLVKMQRRLQNKQRRTNKPAWRVAGIKFYLGSTPGRTNLFGEK
jgi:hypothetical protein